MKKGLDNLYHLRRNFTLIGLTGRRGAGCVEAAEILTNDFNENIESYKIRNPSKIEDTENNRVFLRKYEIIFKYVEKNWFKYKVIYYRELVLLHLLRLTDIEIIKEIKNIYETDGFGPIVKVNGEFENEILFLLNSYIKPNKSLINILIDDNKVKKIRDEKVLKNIYKYYFEKNGFEEFAHKFYNILDKYGISQRINFTHRIGNNLRGSGYPITTEPRYKNCNSIDNIFILAETINRIIKAWNAQKQNAHIVIDSIRNSLEIMYFKERYSAFYMVSINSNFKNQNLKEKLNELYPESQNNIDEHIKEILDIDEIEYRTNDFKKGEFWTPDIENCIQKSDVHLINNRFKKSSTRGKRSEIAIANPLDWDNDKFFSLGEQIMKFHALISHPGIITPSAQERCMQFAYNAKYNSGCISRQVGAVITDSNYSIKAVGWNDVPKGKIPCNLRNAKDLFDDTSAKNKKEDFSTFELGLAEDSKKSKGFYNSFKSSINKINDLNGKNYSFCFKSFYNAYEAEANQVHTRSLHAEENAMLQISKYGGQGLENGLLFTTASPCELCAKKSFQLGIKSIYYIDPYPGISEKHIIDVDSKKYHPEMKLFSGAIGRAYHKLYEPFLAYKDELFLETKVKPELNYKQLIENLINQIDLDDNPKKKLKESLSKLKVDKDLIIELLNNLNK